MLSRSTQTAWRFFSALLLSAFGYEFVFFVMTVHVYGLSGDALLIGVFATLGFVPRLFSSLMGALADRFGKASCLAASALAMAVLLLLMSQAVAMTDIYALWFAASFFLSMIVNARSALMAEVLAPENYASGNALSLTLLNGAKLLAPLSGGFLAMAFGPEMLLRFAGAVYLLTALVALGMASRSKSPPARAREARRAAANGLRLALGRGLAFMRENPAFRQMVAIGFFWRLFLGLQLSLFVVYAKEVLACDNAQYGVFAALIGVGSIAGSLVGPFVARRMRPSRMITVGLSLHYGSFIVLALCNDYLAALEIVFLSYMVFYATIVGLHSARDRITPAAIRGNAYGTVTAILTPPAIVSMIAGGYLANRFGVAAVLGGAGALAFFSLRLILFFSRGTRDLLDRNAALEGVPS